MPSSRRVLSAGTRVALGVAWLVMLAVPPAMLLGVRTEWLAALERPEAQAHWDEFRDAMRRETGTAGPVQRKTPKSAEPPLRVWLRDYVWLAIAAWVVIGGTLGLFTGLLVVGALATGGGRSSPAEDQPRGERDDEEQHERDAEDAEKRIHGG